MKNLSSIVSVLAKLSSFGDRFGAQGKWAKRLAMLPELFVVLMPLGRVDFEDAKKAAKELTDAQREELTVAFGGEFELANQPLEKVIEEGIEFVQSVYAIFMNGKDLFAAAKAVLSGKKTEVIAA